jgi:uncharacterized protein (DUF433 family)
LQEQLENLKAVLPQPGIGSATLEVSAMKLAERIEANPDVMLGRPVIRGTRVSVELILRRISEGATEEALLTSYPHLTRDDVRAAISFAAGTIANEEIVETVAHQA